MGKDLDIHIGDFTDDYERDYTPINDISRHLTTYVDGVYTFREIIEEIKKAIKDENYDDLCVFSRVLSYVYNDCSNSPTTPIYVAYC
jgi:hypothetical protein